MSLTISLVIISLLIIAMVFLVVLAYTRDVAIPRLPEKTKIVHIGDIYVDLSRLTYIFTYKEYIDGAIYYHVFKTETGRFIVYSPLFGWRTDYYYDEEIFNHMIQDKGVEFTSQHFDMTNFKTK